MASATTWPPTDKDTLTQRTNQPEGYQDMFYKPQKQTHIAFSAKEMSQLEMQERAVILRLRA